MDGIHDMGGMHGFGKVEPEPNEPVFHAPWEGRTLALNRAMGYTGIWTIDQTRFGIERLPPDVYLTSSYYRKWAVRLDQIADDHDVFIFASVGNSDSTRSTARNGQSTGRMNTRPIRLMTPTCTPLPSAIWNRSLK